LSKQSGPNRPTKARSAKLVVDSYNGTDKPLKLDSLPDEHLSYYRKWRVSIGRSSTVIDIDDLIRLLAALQGLHGTRLG
jgi:hypothetical protein